MNNLPSINVTYQRVLDLIRQSYFAVFPVALIYAVGQYLINRFIPFTPATTLLSVLNISLQLIYASLLFCIAMEVIYQRYYQLPLNYLNILRKSLERCGPFLLSMLLLFLPTLLMAALLFSLHFFFKLPTEGQLMSTGFELMILIVIINIIGFVYASVSAVFIINQNMKMIDGIKQSYILIKEYWFNTFFLLLTLGVVIWLLAWLFTLLVGRGILSQALVGFFILPLWPALMVVHCYHLQHPENVAT